jgi:hypothetical protein
MKVDMVIAWVGSVEIPEKFKGKGPFEVSCADVAELVKTNDVAYMNQQEGVLALAIDVKGKGFRQR